jgi:hypothetical protein
MEPIDPTRRGLSEISHLFLSSVRDRQTQGAPRPLRTPPPKAPINIELTPEEVPQPAAVAAASMVGSEPTHAPPITAILASHLNGKQAEFVALYARELAARCGRVGLIDLQDGTLNLSCFDPSGVSRGDEPEFVADSADDRQVAEALAELNCDVNHWLVVGPPSRSNESIALLQKMDRCVLLSTCDHDGIVSSYRLLKGLFDLPALRPNLSVALLGAKDDAEATRIAAKLSGVCRQFLSWDMHSEGAVGNSARVASYLVLSAKMTTPCATITAFIDESKALSAPAEMPSAATQPAQMKEEPMDEGMRQLIADLVIPTEPAAAVYPRVAEVHAEHAPMHAAMADKDLANEVLDLAGSDATPDAVITAILHQAGCGAIETPVRAPMCTSARLTVTREKTLELFASTERGLGNLRSIAQAYRWLSENRVLISMALPQLAVDATRLPRLRLIVDQADMSAELLQPMLQNGQITVQTFRRLRWGDKTGLLLEAA